VANKNNFIKKAS